MTEPLKSVRMCAICGKEFIIQRGAGYLYKRQNYKTGKTEYFCGWTCPRKAEARTGHKAEPRAHREKGEPVPGGADSVQHGVQVE